MCINGMRLAKLGTHDVYVPGATHTRRQQLAHMLCESRWSFDALLDVLGGTRRELEDDLAHVDRTLRRHGLRVIIRDGQCWSCHFQFHPHRVRPFRAPGRCPMCHSERVEPPSFYAR